MTSNSTYVRWAPAESRRVREFDGPLAADHPAFLAPCPFCTYRLGDDVGGQPGVALVALGPDDDETRERHEAGRWYSALAIVVHTKCVRGMDDAELEQACTELVPLTEQEAEAAVLAAEAGVDGPG